MVIHHAFWLTLVQVVLAGGGKGDHGSPTVSIQGVQTVNSATVATTSSFTQSGMLIPSNSLPSLTPSDTLLTSGSPPPPTSISSTSTPAQPTASSTDSSLPASPIAFMPLSNATTCTPMILRWQFHPAPSNATDLMEDMQLTVTNTNVTQDISNNSSSSDTNPMLASISINEIISNHTAMSLGTFNWTAVSVPEGWYIVVARPGYPTQPPIQSAKFFVMSGSNTSCIDHSLSSLHSPLSRSALAGTVVGSILGVIAVLGAFMLPRLWRRGIPGHRAWKDGSGKLYHAF